MSAWQSQFRSSAEAKKAGWFSRRHETDKAHREAQLHRQLKADAKREREAEILERFRTVRMMAS